MNCHQGHRSTIVFCHPKCAQNFKKYKESDDILRFSCWSHAWVIQFVSKSQTTRCPNISKKKKINKNFFLTGFVISTKNKNSWLFAKSHISQINLISNLQWIKNFLHFTRKKKTLYYYHFLSYSQYGSKSVNLYLSMCFL